MSTAALRGALTGVGHPLIAISSDGTKPQPRGLSLRCRAETTSQPSETSSKDAMLARIAKAREYKKGGGASTAPPPPPSVAASTAAPAPPQDQSDTVLVALDMYASQQAAAVAAQLSAAQAELAAARPLPRSRSAESDAEPRGVKEVAGDADQAATWLPAVASQGLGAALDGTNLSPEEFTAQKEALRRQRGATIERAKGAITGTRRRYTEVDDYGLAQQQADLQASVAADFAAATAAKTADETQQQGGTPGSAPEGDVHKPKVVTWGVFPRPKNISEAYGGGRNIRPGQALESEDDATARERRVADALKNYRKSMGLDIEPAVEAEATRLLAEGEAMFTAGRISAALTVFTQAADMVPLRSKIGGLVSLQKAICLDSLGRNEEAYGIYKSLKGHTAPGVAKTTQRMMFGFKAAEKLKVHTMDFGGGGTKAWQSYFDRINSGGIAVYKAKPEESEEDKEAATLYAIVAAAVTIGPLVIIAALVAGK